MELTFTPKELTDVLAGNKNLDDLIETKLQAVQDKQLIMGLIEDSKMKFRNAMEREDAGAAKYQLDVITAAINKVVMSEASKQART